ncbi:cytochrome C oxidase subunit IV family protein [Gordonia rhizosphera]|uniref:cytochrome C oxidase subunit IV family protein n=1 Tax=Gordonia rhizosphera TaxID=83341 RepID=UPI001FE20C11|nr:cytochrome C oxidase subunit IV family protein [Gordonia rhizosphera]
MTLGVLCSITVLSWWLGHETGGHSTAIGLAVLAMAFVKVWLILRDFMEVRSAPRWLTLVTGGWLIIVAATSVTLFLN